MAEPTICCVDGCVNATELDHPAMCGPHLKALSDPAATIKVGLSTCTVKGCKQPPHSRFNPYCQMHLARLRRHGSLKRKAPAEVLIHSHGYRIVIAEGHPMAKRTRAYEHRVVYYDAHPSGPDPCHWCKKPLTWDTLQVDHLNTVRDDNRIDNLVASCGGCNRDRAKPAAVRAHRNRARKFMVNGQWLSIRDAARSLRIGESSIRARLESGWPVDKAFTEPRGKFGPHR